jgi:hypothetical protein
MNIAPPPLLQVVFPFQQRCMINSLIGKCQCTYCSIVRALRISNFGFSCSCGCSYEKNIFFREVVDDDNHENILLFALPTLPQHGNGAVSMPRQLPPPPLAPLHISAIHSSPGESGEMMMTMMTIQEVMTMPTISNPILPTHNNQP